jgi:hypothetical protein
MIPPAQLRVLRRDANQHTNLSYEYSTFLDYQWWRVSDGVREASSGQSCKREAEHRLVYEPSFGMSGSRDQGWKVCS